MDYLGHILSREGIAKGPKVDAVRNMPPPTGVAALRSFLGSVQFYAKFLPTDVASVSEPLYRLTRKEVPWRWGQREVMVFNSLKKLLSADNVLTHFDASLPIGIACDASDVGIETVLFHRYPEGNERPISNVSKILTSSQRNFSQIRKEALAIIFALKFFQYLFGRKFILITDPKPLLALFGPSKPTPSLAANRLARWAFFLNQFDQLEYRKSSDHTNAQGRSQDFSKGGAEVMEAKALKKKNCL